MYTAHLENTLPEAASMHSIWNLLQLDPYSTLAASNDLYIAALKENINYHYRNNAFYKQYLDYHGFHADQLQSIADIGKVPYLHANFFKTNVVNTVKEEGIVMQATSSGTTGQKSQHFLDHWTNSAVFYISDVSQLANGFVSEQSCNYLVFNFEPFTGFKTGTATTNQKMMQYAPAEHVNYALRYNGAKGHDFDSFGVIDKLLEYQEEGLPVRMLGFAAFLNFAIDKLKDLGYDSLPLHPDSRCLFGGGWKNHKDKELPKMEFYAKIHEFFGIPMANIRDKYGSVEHPITYVECEQHHLHTPTYERVIVRDVQTMEPLPYGQPGFAHLISPIITSMPSHSILMGDLIIQHEQCSCGKGTPWIEILGRAGTSKNKSCAIAASEMLKR
jgi:phenylacetate-coenzyme A ligase PaaK-like adenylate-forming protein